MAGEYIPTSPNPLKGGGNNSAQGRKFKKKGGKRRKKKKGKGEERDKKGECTYSCPLLLLDSKLKITIKVSGAK